MKKIMVAGLVVLFAVAVQAAPMSVANRTSGVAPLGVFFDAVGNPPLISPTLVPQPYGYADLNFEWSFGDDASAVWAHTGRSKDEAIGFVAAHVYENPGSYFVTLRVTMPDGSQSNHEQTITVTDPNVVFANSSNTAAERTFYVSAVGNDNNNGSLNAPFRTVARGTSRLFASNGPRRLLLRRGDTFAHDNAGTIDNMTGPFQIGAYGTGANPVINSPSVTSELFTFDATTTDVRIMDLEMVGTLAGNCIRPGNNMLIFRNRIANFSNGVTTSSAHGLKQGVVIAENLIDGSDGYGIYFNFGQRVGILGNHINDVNREHLLRCYITHSLVENNLFQGGHVQKSQVKFVGYAPTGDPIREPGTPTEALEYSILSDNIFERAQDVTWMVALGPVDDTKDQRSENIVVERNTFRADTSSRIGLYVRERKVTVRNNTFDATGSIDSFYGVRVSDRGISPLPENIAVYHNSFYRGTAVGALTGIAIDTLAGQTIVRNNLFGGDVTTTIAGTGTGLIAARNLQFCDAGFIDPANGVFELLATSPGIDRGIALPSVYSDFLGVVRPIDGNASGRAERDVGAFEYSPLKRSARRSSATAGR